MISLIFVALAAMIDAAKDSILWYGGIWQKGSITFVTYSDLLDIDMESNYTNVFPKTEWWQDYKNKWGFFHLCERLRPGMWLMAIYCAPAFPLWKLLLFGALVYIVTHEFFLKSVFRREIK